MRTEEEQGQKFFLAKSCPFRSAHVGVDEQKERIHVSRGAPRDAPVAHQSMHVVLKRKPLVKKGAETR